MATDNNRFWEFYYVRYFVGTVVGTIIITALLFHPDSSISDKLGLNFSKITDLKTEHFLISTALGMAFCYIASAPVLILHAYRSQIEYATHFSFASGENWKLKLFITLLPVIVLLVFFTYLFVIGNDLSFFTLGVTGIIWLIISMQISIIISAIINKYEKVFVFYEKLVKARSQEFNTIKSYTESYKHLREHGNAFLIVFFEIILGGALFFSPSVNWSIAMITFWIIPALTVWFIATYLEFRIADIPEK